MRSSALMVSLLVLCSCALRPLYKEIAHPCGADRETLLRLMDKSTRAPLAGLKIEMGENKDRYATTSAADGTFSLPLDKKYADANPYLVVTGKMPNGYDIEAAHDCVLPLVQTPAVTVPLAPPTIEIQTDIPDAGNIEPAAPVKTP